MDNEAVNSADDRVLKEFGLIAQGDIIALRAHCLSKTKSDVNTVKEELRKSIVCSDRLSTKSKKKIKTRMVQFGWLHYNPKGKKYKSVRASKGGGTRDVRVNEKATRKEVLSMAKEIFCSSFKTPFGPSTTLCYELGTFSQNMIANQIEVNGQYLDFTLGSYIEKFHLSKTRIYLMTKKKSVADYCDEYSETEALSVHDVNEAELMKMDHEPEKTLSEVIDLTGSQLIGTNAERKSLNEEIAAAYEESLCVDKLKDKEKHDKQQKIINQENKAKELQLARQYRIPSEPQLSEEHVVISVRHISAGTIRRIFPSAAKVNSIYDWVGSVALFPMFFQLMCPPVNAPISPSDSVKFYSSCVLNMSETDGPIPLEEECEVAWFGFKAKAESDVFAYADDEAELFLKKMEADKVNATKRHVVEDVMEDVKCCCNLREKISSIESILGKSEEGPTIIVHRRPETFWTVLLRQDIDLLKSKRVIWAGEPCADDGGPYREFLLVAMESLPSLNAHFFGTDNSLFFTGSPQNVISNDYYFLGQLCAVSIVQIGRGPNCFNPALVKFLFTGVLDIEVTDIDDGQLYEGIKNIEKGDMSLLYDANIVPVSSEEQNITLYKQYYCLISRVAAIEQFKCGINSISSSFLASQCCVQRFFLKENIDLKYQDIRNLIEFIRGSEGSFLNQESAIIEFELFLASLSIRENGLSLSDFLRFVAGVDRIPVTGFKKKIEIFVTEDDLLPRVSTCGLIMYIPANVTKERLEFSLKEGTGAYGTL